MSSIYYLCLFIFLIKISFVFCSSSRPNIIFIVADDAGFNDFSFHGSPQIPTPNIDALALSGIILNKYYANPLCTPSRGSILTGKYPIHTRLQHFVIMGQNPEGLPLEEILLSQYLKELGYATHLVGKWHLGHAHKEYTPTYRGFDSHSGYWLGKRDYYEHTCSDGEYWGIDSRSNMTVDYSNFGRYDTDIFTEKSIEIIKNHQKSQPLFLMIAHLAPHRGNEYMPQEAPEENVDKFSETITDIHRRVYAGKMDKLDESVGKVVEALQEEKMLNNSIIIFASDNGGTAEGFDMNYGSNWPLRGVKSTLWEGGTRLSAFIWSSLLTKNKISLDMMHAIDWLPTLYDAAGGNSSEIVDNIDGISLWQTLSVGQRERSMPTKRNSFLYNIDDIYNNSAARLKNWKLIQGSISTFDFAGKWDGWYGPSGRENKSISVHDLIAKIQNSVTGQSLRKIGIHLDKTKLKKLQNEAQINCHNNNEANEIPHLKVPCDPYTSACLFDIDNDPCELYNLINVKPQIAQQIQEMIKNFRPTALDPISRYLDPDSAPSKWNYVWTNWKDYI